MSSVSWSRKLSGLMEFVTIRLSVQPIHRFEQATELRVVHRQSRQPFANWLAFPPRFLADWSESITIKSRTNAVRWHVWKGIVSEERERAWIVVQKFPSKMQCPRIFVG